MTAICIFLGVTCGVLLLLLSKNSKLVADVNLMKGRMEGLQERLVREAPSADEPLTAEGIAEAVQRAGFVPEVSENWVRFMIHGEPYYVETGRLPQIFVVRAYTVDTKEWEMDLLAEEQADLEAEKTSIEAQLEIVKQEKEAITIMLRNTKHPSFPYGVL